MESTAHWKLEGGRAELCGSSLRAEIDLNDPARGVHRWMVDGHPLSGSALGLKLPEPWHTSSVEAYVRGTDLIATYLSADEHARRVQIYWRLRPDLTTLVSPEKASRVTPHDARLPLLAAIELVVSVQTQRWSDRPRMSAQSHLNAATAELFVHGAQNKATMLQPLPVPREGQAPTNVDTGTSCVCFALPESNIAGDAQKGLSYIELVHPADHEGTTLTSLPAATSLATDETAHPAAGNLLVAQSLFADNLEKGVILRARILGAWLGGPLLAAPLGRLYDAFVQEKLPLTT